MKELFDFIEGGQFDAQLFAGELTQVIQLFFSGQFDVFKPGVVEQIVQPAAFKGVDKGVDLFLAKAVGRNLVIPGVGEATVEIGHAAVGLEQNFILDPAAIGPPGAGRNVFGD
jgi:hypothetical protein